MLENKGSKYNILGNERALNPDQNPESGAGVKPEADAAKIVSQRIEAGFENAEIKRAAGPSKEQQIRKGIENLGTKLKSLYVRLDESIEKAVKKGMGHVRKLGKSLDEKFDWLDIDPMKNLGEEVRAKINSGDRPAPEVPPLGQVPGVENQNNPADGPADFAKFARPEGQQAGEAGSGNSAEKPPVVQMGESLLSNTKEKIKAINEQLKSLDEKRSKLEAEKRNLEKYANQIRRVLEGEGYGPSMFDSPEKGKIIERKGAKGNTAVAAALQSYKGDRITNPEGAKLFVKKFLKGEKLNNTDRMVALSILEGQKNKSLGFGKSDRVLERAVQHLREELQRPENNENWIPDPGKVSNFVELQAMLQGGNSNFEPTIDKLRKVEPNDDIPRSKLALTAISDMEYDKDPNFHKALGEGAQAELTAITQRLRVKLGLEAPDDMEDGEGAQAEQGQDQQAAQSGPDSRRDGGRGDGDGRNRRNRRNRVAGGSVSPDGSGGGRGRGRGRDGRMGSGGSRRRSGARPGAQPVS